MEFYYRLRTIGRKTVGTRLTNRNRRVVTAARFYAKRTDAMMILHALLDTLATQQENCPPILDTRETIWILRFAKHEEFHLVMPLQQVHFHFLLVNDRASLSEVIGPFR